MTHHSCDKGQFLIEVRTSACSIFLIKMNTKGYIKELCVVMLCVVMYTPRVYTYESMCRSQVNVKLLSLFSLNIVAT